MCSEKKYLIINVINWDLNLIRSYIEKLPGWHKGVLCRRTEWWSRFFMHAEHTLWFSVLYQGKSKIRRHKHVTIVSTDWAMIISCKRKIKPKQPVDDYSNRNRNKMSWYGSVTFVSVLLFLVTYETDRPTSANCYNRISVDVKWTGPSGLLIYQVVSIQFFGAHQVWLTALTQG